MPSVLSSLFNVGTPYPSAPPQGVAITQQKLAEEVSPFYKDLLQKSQALHKERADEGYMPYTGPTIADWSPEQQQAFTGISGLVGTQAPVFDEATALTRGTTAQFTPETAQELMSPYQQAVTDVELRKAQERYEGETLPGLQAQAAQIQPFGGSRQAIVEGMASQNQAQLLADIQARGSLASYQDAQRIFEDQIQREGAAASQLATLGQAKYKAQAGEFGAQQAIGEEKQTMSQAALDDAYRQFLEEKRYPEDILGRYQATVQGFPALRQEIQRTAPPPQPSLANQLIGGLGTIGSLYGAYGGFTPQGFGSSLPGYGPVSRPAKTGGGLQDIIHQAHGSDNNLVYTSFMNRPSEEDRVEDITIPDYGKNYEQRSEYENKVLALEDLLNKKTEESDELVDLLNTKSKREYGSSINPLAMPPLAQTFYKMMSDTGQEKEPETLQEKWSSIHGLSAGGGLGSLPMVHRALGSNIEVGKSNPNLSTLESVNADILSRNGEGAVFTYDNKNYKASSRGPTLMHDLTQKGTLDRAITGGLFSDRRAPTGVRPGSPESTIGTGPTTPRLFGPETYNPDPTQILQLGREPQLWEQPQPVVQGRPPDLSNIFKQSDPTQVPLGQPLPVGPSRVIAPSEQALATGPFINQGQLGIVEQQPQPVKQLGRPPDLSNYFRDPNTPPGPRMSAGLRMMRKNPETGNWEEYRDPNIMQAGGGPIIARKEGGLVSLPIIKRQSNAPVLSNQDRFIIEEYNNDRTMGKRRQVLRRQNQHLVNQGLLTYKPLTKDRMLTIQSLPTKYFNFIVNKATKLAQQGIKGIDTLLNIEFTGEQLETENIQKNIINKLEQLEKSTSPALQVDPSPDQPTDFGDLTSDADTYKKIVDNGGSFFNKIITKSGKITNNLYDNYFKKNIENKAVNTNLSEGEIETNIEAGNSVNNLSSIDKNNVLNNQLVLDQLLHSSIGESGDLSAYKKRLTDAFASSTNADQALKEAIRARDKRITARINAAPEAIRSEIFARMAQGFASMATSPSPPVQAFLEQIPGFVEDTTATGKEYRERIEDLEDLGIESRRAEAELARGAFTREATIAAFGLDEAKMVSDQTIARLELISEQYGTQAIQESIKTIKAVANTMNTTLSSDMIGDITMKWIASGRTDATLLASLIENAGNTSQVSELSSDNVNFENLEEK